MPKKHGQAKDLWIKVQEKQDYISFEVKDNGSKGMADYIQEELFSPFKSYKIMQKGQHVGLPTVKKLMEIFHGKNRTSTQQNQEKLYLK